MVHTKVAALAALATFITSSASHSWIEQMMVISGQGQFIGNPGYARNATSRTAPGFSDPLMVHILPGLGQPSIEERGISSTDTAGIKPTDPMCKKTQQQQIQSSGLPRLSAAPGSLVALRYQENGHVSLPQNQLGKPPNRGTVYIYGTTQPKPEENFLDVFNQWNADGSGGDKRGKLIATQPYDDGQCYQVNSGSISQQRQQQFPHPADPLMGTDLWCQNDIKLPTDAVSGKPYTLYWVWDWPTEPGVDPSVPNGKAEIYTTCMDIDVTAASKRDLIEARALQPQASGNAVINNAAIPSYMNSLATSGSAPPAAPSTPPPSVPSAQISAPAASAPAASAPAASAPAASAPAASAPAAAASAVPPAASVPEAAMNPSVAASIVEAAIGSEISSLFAAQSGAVTDTAQVETVTVTAEAQSQATQSPSASSLSTATSPVYASSAASPSAAGYAAGQASQPASAPPAGSPPASMNIVPPVISGISGTATAVSAVPSAGPTSSVVAGASSGPKCKRTIKRSRILGHA